MSHSGPPSRTFITIMNDAALIAIVLEGFLHGVYTTLLMQVIRRFVRKKNKMPYLAVLVALWITISVGFSMDFKLVRTGYVVHNSSPLDMVAYFMNDKDPSTIVYMILNRICYTLAMSMADGLLSWRCYILWDGNRWITSLLVILFTATNVTGFVTSAPQTAFPRPVLNGLVSFFYLSSATTTLLATTLIIWKICSVTNKSTSGYSYRAIIQLLINSGFIYTACTVIVGIMILYSTYHTLPITDSSARYASAATIIGLIAHPITGLAPTLIALSIDNGVALVDTSSDSLPISHLTFRRTRHGDVPETAGMSSGLDMGPDSSVHADYLVRGAAGHPAKGIVDGALWSPDGDSQDKKSQLHADLV